jgi:hypothetical protein
MVASDAGTRSNEGMDMKTRILDVTRRGAASARCVALLAAAMSLPLVSGCTMDEPATTSTTQGLGASCTIWRPVAWDGAATACAEGRFAPFSITLQDGDSATFHSANLPGMGVGEVRLICDNGGLDTDPWDDICIPNRGGIDP